MCNIAHAQFFAIPKCKQNLQPCAVSQRAKEGLYFLQDLIGRQLPLEFADQRLLKAGILQVSAK